VPKVRTDGAEIHWEARGEGPLVVLVHGFNGDPETLSGLLDDLATDHRVVTYDLRGSRESSREGPFSLEVDAADLAAVVEAAGGPAIAIALADGTNRAVKCAAARPDLITHVVSPGGNPVSQGWATNTESLAASGSVLDAIVEMLATDYRGALRTIISSANAQMSEDEIRAAVARAASDYSQDGMVGRLRSWIGDDSAAEGRALGDRLWVYAHPFNPWFTVDTLDATRAALPEAHAMEVEDGPVSRPDITAGLVRKLSGGG